MLMSRRCAVKANAIVGRGSALEPAKNHSYIYRPDAMLRDRERYTDI